MYLIHPSRPGQGINVPDPVAADYIGQGWHEPGTAPGDPLDRMTVAQLKAHAAERGIDLAGASRKADMLDRIRAAAAL